MTRPPPKGGAKEGIREPEQGEGGGSNGKGWRQGCEGGDLLWH